MYKSNVQRQRISQWYHHRISLSDIITALREDFGRWFDVWRRFSHLAHIEAAVQRVIVGGCHLMQLSKEGACKSGYPTHTTYCQVSWGIRLGACGVSSCLSWARSPRCMQCSTPLGETEEVSSRWRSESRSGTLRSLCRLPVDSCLHIRFPSWWSRQVATGRLFPEKKDF